MFVMLNRTLNVPLNLVQTFSRRHFVSKNHLKKKLFATMSIELSSALESSQRMNELSTELHETCGMNNLLSNIRKKKPLLNNALLNTLKLKNVLGCSKEKSMCHQSSYRPAINGALKKDIEKTSKMLFGYLELSWTLKCSQEHSTSVKACYIPPPRSLVLNGTPNIPLKFLQTFWRWCGWR